VNNTV